MSAARPRDPDRREPRALSPRARRLVDDAQATDRAGRFRVRLEQVIAHRVRRSRRQQVTKAVALAALAVSGVALGALMGGLIGAVIGTGAVATVWAVRQALRLLAPRRGASAWDWRAEQYRLIGDPSKEVQNLDRPRD